VVALSVLADDPFPALALVLGGLLSMFVAAYGKRDDSHLDELGTYFGFILGAVMLVMAFFVAIEKTVNWFTLTVMIILAVTLFLKPLKEIPWTGVAGLVAGAAAAYGASLYLHSPVFGIKVWIILVVIFFIVGGIVHFLFRFIGDLLKVANMVLDWRPVMVLVGLVAVVEGVLLFLNSSLISLF
jgi:hypothetical protein